MRNIITKGAARRSAGPGAGLDREDFSRSWERLREILGWRNDRVGIAGMPGHLGRFPVKTPDAACAEKWRDLDERGRKKPRAPPISAGAFSFDFDAAFELGAFQDGNPGGRDIARHPGFFRNENPFGSGDISNEFPVEGQVTDRDVGLDPAALFDDQVVVFELDAAFEMPGDDDRLVPGQFSPNGHRRADDGRPVFGFITVTGG